MHMNAYKTHAQSSIRTHTGDAIGAGIVAHLSRFELAESEAPPAGIDENGLAIEMTPGNVIADTTDEKVKSPGDGAPV